MFRTSKTTATDTTADGLAIRLEGSDMTQNVRILDYHRNGIAGLGFHVAIVEEVEDSNRREMLVIRFPQSADKETGAIVCAAFDLAKLDQREVRFIYNSWRGDHYHGAVDAAIAERDANYNYESSRKQHDTPAPGFERHPNFTVNAA